MKKTLLTILSGVVGVMIFATPVFAATSVSFTPVNVSVRQGQTFTLIIGVNPQGVKNYTVKTELQFPAELLEIESFTFANSWMPVVQPGYDLIDNTNGVFIKTAGYPGGVSSAITFGTISFLAKKSGDGTIALNSDSFVLDANNQNVLSNTLTQTVVEIIAPIPIRTTEKTPATSVIETTEEEVVLEEEVIVAPEELVAVSQSEEEESQSLLAAVGSFLTFGTNNNFVGFLVVLIAGYVLYAVIQRIRRKNLRKLQ